MYSVEVRAFIWRSIYPHLRVALAVASLLLVGLLGSASAALADTAPTLYTGDINGAAYRVEVPANWNGTLLLYSHGYTIPGSANPAQDVGDPTTGAALLAQGYALAGSSYRSTGWAVEDALEDQIALLDWVNVNVGKPSRTIAWGHSLGGIVTAGLVQEYPDRFDGALPMCGVVGGGIGVWNQALDAAYAFKTLIAPDANLAVVHIANPGANSQAALAALTTAQGTTQGRARLALVGALDNTPGWFTFTQVEPAAADWATRQTNQYQWFRNMTFPFAFSYRAELEARAGGNPSWNTGVNYRLQLARSGMRPMVEALYQAAGLNLEEDLTTLEGGERIKANPAAMDYLTKNITFDGQLDIPVLTMHTTDDGLVAVQNEAAYANVVNTAGRQAMLRQLFVHRPGHCIFTPAEHLTALQILLERVTTHQWVDTSNPAALNATAAAMGPNLNLLPSAFVQYQPTPALRPYDRHTPNPAVVYMAPLRSDTAGGPVGQVTITRSVSGDYVVRVVVSGLEPGSAHAIHFHRGTCDVQGGIIQVLPNLVAGRDGTVRSVSWLSKMQLAAVVADASYVNIHEEGAAPIGGGIMCGNVL